MDFEIIISKKAQAEMENALDYYSEINTELSNKFFTEITECYQNLAKNPYFEIRYKNYRAIQLRKFPFLLFYVVEEDKNQIKILSCFHTSRNPKKHPK